MKIKIILLFCFLANGIYAQKSAFTSDEMKADLVFLKQKLIEKHPNLYTYSTPKEVNDFFENLSLNLPDNLTNLEAYKIVGSLSNILKDGHSYIYPSTTHLEMFYSSGLLFPFDVFWDNENLYILRDLTIKQKIPVGSKITAINGVSIAEIHQTISQNSSRDGDNMAYPNFLFHEFFPAYYSFFYGFQKDFTIEIITKDGTSKTLNESGLSRNKRKEQKKMYYPESLDGSITNPGISSWNHLDKNYVILKIQSFDNKMLKTNYQKNFKKKIKKTFQNIIKKDSPNLVIDLRGNQGGELSNGLYLLQYLMQEPFQCVKSYYKVGKGKDYYLKQMISKWDNIFKPKKQVFNGNLFLLVDGGSYSCSAIVAHTIQQYKRATIIGTMTGGSAFVNSGGPNELVVLPNSKIQFTIPKTKYVLQDLSNIGQGVKPDYEVQMTIEALLKNRDLHLEQVEQLIKK